MKCLRLWLVLVLFSVVVISCSSVKQPVLKESQITLKGQALEELISESGVGGNDFDTDITYANFPYSPTSGVVRVVKICLGYTISYKQMREYLERKGMQAANIGQLLVYRSQYLEGWPLRLLAPTQSLKKNLGLSYCPYIWDSLLFDDLDLTMCGDSDTITGSDCVLAVPRH